VFSLEPPRVGGLLDQWWCQSAGILNIDESHYFSYVVLYESNCIRYATAISLYPM
jgi:hypothetical protein